MCIEASEINEELDRILASVEFQEFDPGCRLLQYVVGEAVAGRQQHLDISAVAHVVFDRDNSYDEKSDPVARIQTNRTRRALERYYSGGGQNNQFRIFFPKDGYVPMFLQCLVDELAIVDRSFDEL